MIHYLSEIARILIRRFRVFFFGIRHYSGSPEDMAYHIIKDCYNVKNECFMVSAGHFSVFYARDFGWCTEALLKLGYRKEVLNTLSYALTAFEKHGRIEQSITMHGRAFTFPDKYSPDALAFLVRSLRLAKAKALVRKHKTFLEKEVGRYYDTVIEPKTGLVRKNVSFSSIKDYSVRQSSCYDNVMTAMLSEDLSYLKMNNPLKACDYRKLIIRKFWKRNYFLDDLSGFQHVCGDANVMPFWSGLIDDKAMLRKALATMRNEGLDVPFPLKYTARRFRKQKMISLELFAGNYERDAVWMHIGLMFIRILAQVDRPRARACLAQYEDLMAKHRNFLEVFDKKGRPFRTLFYYSDESMLWVANYLYLKKLLR
jgi:hypothetical protein